MWKTEQEAAVTFCPLWKENCKTTLCSMWVFTENPKHYNHYPREYSPHSHGIKDGYISWEKGATNNVCDRMPARGKCGLIHSEY